MEKPSAEIGRKLHLLVTPTRRGAKHKAAGSGECDIGGVTTACSSKRLQWVGGSRTWSDRLILAVRMG